MSEFINVNQIELHYFFNDDSHSLDAFTRNKCEAEFLFIVKEVLKTFDLDIKIETVVPQEGGLKELWTLIGNNNAQLSVIIGLLSLILSQMPYTDKELTQLQKENLRLSIKEHKLKIEQLEENKPLPNKEKEDIIKYFNSDYKILKHRSSFYETIKQNEKITKLTTSNLYNNKIVQTVKTIERDDFHKYIKLENKLPVEIIDDAEIEIISPILKKGTFKWKGIYNNNSIDFYMKDKIFKESVFNGKESFSSGYNIKCVLEIKNAIDELGEIKVKSYSILTVLSKLEYDNNKTIEKTTQQGKEYLKSKKSLSQPGLFDLVSQINEKDSK